MKKGHLSHKFNFIECCPSCPKLHHHCHFLKQCLHTWNLCKTLKSSQADSKKCIRLESIELCWCSFSDPAISTIYWRTWFKLTFSKIWAQKLTETLLFLRSCINPPLIFLVGSCSLLLSISSHWTSRELRLYLSRAEMQNMADGAGFSLGVWRPFCPLRAKVVSRGTSNLFIPGCLCDLPPSHSHFLSLSVLCHTPLYQLLPPHPLS